MTTFESFSSIVKYSRLQSTLSPMRRIWLVMVSPDCSFHSHTLRDEVLAAQVVAAEALLLQLALDHDLRRDAGVVGARHPQRVVAPHAVVARQAVHDGLVERMAHVQRAGHVRRRQLDRERGLGRVERAARRRRCAPTAAPSVASMAAGSKDLASSVMTCGREVREPARRRTSCQRKTVRGVAAIVGGRSADRAAMDSGDDHDDARAPCVPRPAPVPLLLAACGGGGDGDGGSGGAAACDARRPAGLAALLLQRQLPLVPVEPDPAPAGYASVGAYFDALLYTGDRSGGAPAATAGATSSPPRASTASSAMARPWATACGHRPRSAGAGRPAAVRALRRAGRRRRRPVSVRGDQSALNGRRPRR